jgi:phosphoserine aminotransferase
VKPAKKAQAALFSSGPSPLADSILQDIRKELRAIAEMLK